MKYVHLSSVCTYVHICLCSYKQTNKKYDIVGGKGKKKAKGSIIISSRGAAENKTGMYLDPCC